jgi:hypothetical protein
MEVDFMSSENNKTAFDADKAEAFSEKLLTQHSQRHSACIEIRRRLPDAGY